jgi:hypothetical protein
MPEGPSDRCPYARPFPDHFRGCPAYQPSRIVAFSSGYTPLATVWTCGHLDVGAGPGRFYPRCRVGDAMARQRWVATQRADRLVAIRALQDELSVVLNESITALWAAKARQLRSDPGSTEWHKATAQMRDRGSEFLATLEAFLRANAATLESLGFPLEPCMRLFDDLLEAWVVQPNSEVPVIPDSVLDPFPPDTRRFFKPDYGQGTDAA